MRQDRTALLCLGGGNALGAYQAGFCAALLEGGFQFPVIAATSIGAVHAALIAGHPPDRQVAALTAFWQAARKAPLSWPPLSWSLSARRATLVQTLLQGHPRLMRPKVPGLLSLLAGLEVGRALFDRAPMAALLAGLIDFDRLNRAGIRLRFAAVDARSGETLCFDSLTTRITLDHLMAVTAFPLLFDPVQIGGRAVVDAGVRRNLPLDLLADVPQDIPQDAPTLALDLFPLRGALPDSLTAMAARAQDLALGGQAADAVARFPAGRRLVHAVPDRLSDMTATKSLDFSAAMIAARWQRGAGDAVALLDGWDRLPAAMRWHLQAGRMTAGSDAAGDPAINAQALPGDVA